MSAAGKLQRNDAGNPEEAMFPPVQSLAISNEPGMRSLLERVLSRRNISEA